MEIARVVRLVFGGSLLFLLSCATNFTGSPHVEGGRAGCEKKCKEIGRAHV